MIPVKHAMEERGLNVDISKLKGLIKATEQSKKDVEFELRKSFGIRGNCNFNSSKDVSDILSEKLGVKPRTTRTGRCSTTRRILKGIHNPVTDEIIKYRDLEQLLSSLNAIYKATDRAKGKIFCRYLDDCPTGRIYSQGYSVQSIPAAARSIIIPDNGCSFILADYNSFELRILSALSHDRYFKYCWAKGLDLHRKVVADMKNKSIDAVTDKERKLGKCLNFGQSYGQQATGLARNLNISVNEAQDLMDIYKGRIPEIEAFKLEAVKKARSTGFVETYYGRKRFLPDIVSPNTRDRKKSERRVTNHCCQGTAADIVKFALVSLHTERFKISTTVHDSILLSVPKGKEEPSLKQIKEIMEIEMEGMMFPVSCKTGKTWKDCY